MNVALVTLLLIAATALTSLLTRISRVPGPLLQITTGVLIALAGFRLRLEPDVFMLLFIPPLLFADAYTMPLREMHRLRGPILALALGLVLFSTLSCGWAMHWFEPGLPLAAAFALAAVLSPTDAVAVGAMLEGRSASRRMMHILSGEALLNDASGLVCFKFAVVATMQGSFHLATAAATFAQMVGIGIAVGVALGWLAVRLTAALEQAELNSAPTHVTLITLLPFGAYLVADRLGGSGILAAVAAGISVNRFGQYGERAEVRLQSQAVWSLIGFLFNGIIFLLLGLQLPDIAASAALLARHDGVSIWRLPEAVILLTLALAVLRLLWIRFALAVRWTNARLRRRSVEMPPLLVTLAMTVAGVRGAITLAAVLSLPIATTGVAGFPHRGLLIAAAAGVIICSMLLAAILLPILVRLDGRVELDPTAREIEAARLELAQAALTATEQYRDRAPLGDHEAARAAASVLADQQRRLASLQGVEQSEDGTTYEEALRLHRRETALRLRAVRTQRTSLGRLLRARTIDNDAARELLRELDIEESGLLTTARSMPRSDSG